MACEGPWAVRPDSRRRRRGARDRSEGSRRRRAYELHTSRRPAPGTRGSSRTGALREHPRRTSAFVWRTVGSWSLGRRTGGRFRRRIDSTPSPGHCA
jgi:hypothetical protein